MAERPGGVEGDPAERPGQVGKGPRVLARGADTGDPDRHVQPQDERLVAGEGAAGRGDLAAGRVGEIGLGAWVLAVAARPTRKLLFVPAGAEQVERCGPGDDEVAVAARAVDVEDALDHVPLLPRRARGRRGG